MSVVQQPSEIDLPQPDSEWTLLSRTRLVRRLRGVELLVRSSEHFCDGNFQLSVKATLESPLSSEQLRRRHQAAWWRTRRVFPVIGVAFPTLDQALFDLHETAEEAKRWAAQTCVVATNTTVSDVYLARIRQPSNTANMTLVVDPIRGARGVVLTMSHTLTSLSIFQIVQEYVLQLARPDTELGINAIFTPETTSTTLPHLPQSLSHAYSLLYPQPTRQDLQDAFTVQQQAQDRWSRSSIGIPLHASYQTRPSRMHNKTITFEPSEAKTAFRFLKDSGITLTAAFFACMTSAIAHSFPCNEPTQVEGAHLLFSANGRRFLDLSPRNGNGPISMPILPAGMWLDATDVNIRPTTPKGLLRLARAIETAQNQDLVSPHIITAIDQLAPSLVKALSDAGGPPPPPLIGRPTLTSQGQYSTELEKVLDRSSSKPTATATAKAGEGPIRITELNCGGRSTDPSVCFALSSFRDELRFNLLFDERFFDQHDVLRMGYMVARLFRRLIGEELGGSVLAKL